MAAQLLDSLAVTLSPEPLVLVQARCSAAWPQQRPSRFVSGATFTMVPPELQFLPTCFLDALFFDILGH
jgi:hypothetical protein